MDHSETLPIRHIVPIDHENRWTDLLAVLIEADPMSVESLLGLGNESRLVHAWREAGVGRDDRIDLLCDVGGETRSAIEVKVLSGLGVRQLTRYREAFPGAANYILVYPARLMVDVGAESG